MLETGDSVMADRGFKYRKAKVCPIQGCYKTVKKLSQHIHVANPRLSKEQRLQCTKLAKEERTKKQQFPRIKVQSSITSFTREKTQPQQNPWSEVTSGGQQRGSPSFNYTRGMSWRTFLRGYLVCRGR